MVQLGSPQRSQPAPLNIFPAVAPEARFRGAVRGGRLGRPTAGVEAKLKGAQGCDTFRAAEGAVAGRLHENLAQQGLAAHAYELEERAQMLMIARRGAMGDRT